MSKYVFKNPEVEKALRLVAKELGFSDDQFDLSIETWSGATSIRITHKGLALLSFSTDLLKVVKEFNPNDWNSSEVEPPRDQDDDDCSPIMLIENDDGYPSKGFFVFTTKQWLELGTGEFLECSRYRLYPYN